MKVEWVSNCQYLLSTISEFNRDSFDVDKTYENYSIKILNNTDTSYLFETEVIGTDFIDKATMYLISN